MQALGNKSCRACEGLVEPLSREQASELKRQIHADWQLVNAPASIRRRFEFRNYYHCTAFVQAATYIAHREDHHPDITFGYNYCEITYWTHAVNGLSENDFICAAKTDQLADEQN